MYPNLPTRTNIIILIAVFLIPFITTAQDSTYNYRSTTLKEAVDRKEVSINITGSYDPTYYYEVMDKSGVHYGKCMDILLQSNADSPLLLKLPCGMMLIPEDDSVQRMIVTKEVNFPMPPGAAYRTRFYAMCAQMHLNAPLFLYTFTLGEMADGELLALAHLLDSTNNQGMAGQHAVWAYTDNASTAELEEYGADSNTLKQTAALLNSANVRTALNDPAQANKTDDSKVLVDKTTLYAGIGLTGLLAITTLILATRKRKKVA